MVWRWYGDGMEKVRREYESDNWIIVNIYKIVYKYTQCYRPEE